MFRTAFVNSLSAFFTPGENFNAEKLRSKFANIGVRGGAATDQYTVALKKMLTVASGFHPENLIDGAVGAVTTDGSLRLDRVAVGSYVLTDIS
ncbi:hypothetical protein [Lacipirellula sp.]|uniref:hypothetical protein n=1 Tax=Lacipirellula sp. TaxID=2691419 RepID=UPI003D109484